MAIVLIEKWAFKVFCLSTIFITIFSVQAIYIWPPIAEKLSLFLACILPIGMVILSRISLWQKTRQIPKEFIWILLIFSIGVLSCLFSENLAASLKSMGLFLASGPFVFFTAKILFESKNNQESYLWLTSLGLLACAIWGIYEHFTAGIVYLFSRNPLPAGALLLLFSTGPMIFLHKTKSKLITLALFLGLSSSVFLIVLMAKKSHFLGLLVLLTTLIIFNFRRFYKFFLGFIFLAGISFYSSDSLRERYENVIHWPTPSSELQATDSQDTKQNLPLSINGSISLRAENYYFGLHVIQHNPVWGLGFGGDLDPYLKDYTIQFENYFSKERYREYMKTLNTFENIVLTYTLEWGCLFSIIYFGGIIFIVANFLKTTNEPETRKFDGIIVVAVIFSFAAMSLTFDTLRFPNLNWIFHSILGLLANFPNKQPDLV